MGGGVGGRFTLVFGCDVFVTGLVDAEAEGGAGLVHLLCLGGWVGG